MDRLRLPDLKSRLIKKTSRATTATAATTHRISKYSGTLGKNMRLKKKIAPPRDPMPSMAIIIFTSGGRFFSILRYFFIVPAYCPNSARRRNRLWFDRLSQEHFLTR